MLQTDWGSMIRETYEQPRAVARRLLGMNVPLSVIAEAAAAVAAVEILSLHLLSLFTHDPLFDPLVHFALSLCITFASAALIQGGGSLFGGRGTYEGALKLIVWLSIAALPLTVAARVAGLVVPPVSGILIIGAVLFTFYLLVNFVAELHEFKNVLAVVGGMLAFSFGLAVAISIVASSLGLVPVPMPGAS